MRPYLENSFLSSLKPCSLDTGWKCRSWTPAHCRLHEAAYPSRSAPSVLLPRDNFPRCLSNVSVGCSMTRPCIKSAWSLCLWSPLSAFKAAHQLLLLCPAFLFFFFPCQLRRSLICNIIFTVQQRLWKLKWGSPFFFSFFWQLSEGYPHSLLFNVKPSNGSYCTISKCIAFCKAELLWQVNDLCFLKWLLMTCEFEVLLS